MEIPSQQRAQENKPQRRMGRVQRYRIVRCIVPLILNLDLNLDADLDLNRAQARIMMRLAILDDYQRAALAMADWESLRPAVEVRTFHDTLAGEDALAERLRDFEIIVAMR